MKYHFRFNQIIEAYHSENKQEKNVVTDIFCYYASKAGKYGRDINLVYKANTDADEKTREIL